MSSLLLDPLTFFLATLYFLAIVFGYWCLDKRPKYYYTNLITIWFLGQLFVFFFLINWFLDFQLALSLYLLHFFISSVVIILLGWQQLFKKIDFSINVQE